MSLTKKDISKIRANFSDSYTHFFTLLRRSWVNILMQKEFRNLVESKQDDLVNIETYGDCFIIDAKSPIGIDTQQNIRLRGRDILKTMDSVKGGGDEWVYEWTFVTIFGFFEALIFDLTKEEYRIQNPTWSNDKIEEKINKDSYKNLATRLSGQNFSLSKLNELIEIIERRNVIVHRKGKVDKKYIDNLTYKGISLPSLNGSEIKINDKIKIEHIYLENTIQILDSIGSEYANQLYFKLTGDSEPLRRTKR